LKLSAVHHGGNILSRIILWQENKFSGRRFFTTKKFASSLQKQEDLPILIPL